MELAQETQDHGGWGSILMYKDTKKEISRIYAKHNK